MYDNEHDLIEAINEIHENHSNDTSSINFLTINASDSCIHHSATGRYYVVQFYNMVIVLNDSNDKVLYVTDFGDDINTSAQIESSADGKILCIRKLGLSIPKTGRL